MLYSVHNTEAHPERSLRDRSEDHYDVSDIA